MALNSEDLARAGNLRETRSRMHVERVLDVSGFAVRYVIRCTFGTIQPGVRVAVLRSDGICEDHPSAYVLKMWRYGSEVDLLDPPHGAVIELEGELADSVAQGITLCVLL
jgi:hypothetical protein